MKYILGLFLIITGIFVAVVGEAQQPTKVPRIGIITTGSPAAFAHLLEGFKQGLRERGYVDGQNVHLELRYAEGKADQLPIFADELVNLKVDVIVAIPNSSIDAVRKTTQTIPIVMPIGSDPVGIGFAASLARPGGNITGGALILRSSTVNGWSFLKKRFPSFPGWLCS